MASCDLSIHLEREDAHFRPGDAIAGHVEVRAREATQCDRLTIALRWRTGGAGNVDEQEDTPKLLFHGAWREGEVLRYPFSITAPLGPLTYRGQLVTVGWFLRAHADVPWARDPAVEAPIVLEPWTTDALLSRPGVGYRSGLPRLAQSYRVGPARKEQGALAEETKNQKEGELGCGLLSLVVAPLMAYFVTDFGVRVFFAAVLVFGVAMLFSYFKRRRIENRLGKPALKVDKEIVQPGDRVTVQVSLRPGRALELNEISARLVCLERAVKGSGSNTKAEKLELHSAIVHADARDLTLRGGKTSAANLEVMIPLDAASSFGSASNEVTWEVTVKVATRDGEVWEERYRIAVEPPKPEALMETPAIGMRAVLPPETPREAREERGAREGQEEAREAQEEARAHEEEQALSEAQADEEAQRRLRREG